MPGVALNPSPFSVAPHRFFNYFSAWKLHIIAHVFAFFSRRKMLNEIRCKAGNVTTNDDECIKISSRIKGNDYQRLDKKKLFENVRNRYPKSLANHE